MTNHDGDCDDGELELEIACRKLKYGNEKIMWAKRLYQTTNDSDEENATNLQHVISREFLKGCCGYKYEPGDFIRDHMRNPVNKYIEELDFKRVDNKHEKVIEYKNLVEGLGTRLINFNQMKFYLATTNTIKKILSKAPTSSARNLIQIIEDIKDRKNQRLTSFTSEPSSTESMLDRNLEDELKAIKIPGKTSKNVIDWILQIQRPLTRFMFADFIGCNLADKGFRKFLEIKSMLSDTRFLIIKELVECMDIKVIK